MVLATAPSNCALAVALSSFAFDYCARQKVGGTTLNFFIVQQLPAPPPSVFDAAAPWGDGLTLAHWIRPRLLELAYTANDMASFASDLGDTGAPFRWDVARRAHLRAELDACFFHLYGLDRLDTEYVLSTFPIATRKDPELSPRILAAYDALAAAADSGESFVSPLDPPPGLGARHAGIARKPA